MRPALGRALPAALLALLFAGGAIAYALTREDEETAGPGGAAAARTDSWGALAAAGLRRTEVAAARIGDSIYVVGGFEKRSGSTVGALERYSIRRNRWRRLRSMPVGLNHPAAVAYRGKLYVHGGYRARRSLGSATSRLFAYDPRRNRWARLPRSRVPRAAHALAVVGGRLYAAGGANADGSLRSMEVFSFRRRRWSTGPAFPGPRRDHTTGIGVAGRFYVLAGRNLRDAGNYTDVDRFDPDTGRWQRMPPMRKARGGIAAARVSRRIVVFGGEEGAGTIRQVEVFDTGARRWSSLPSMRTARHGLGGAARGRRVYALQGGPRPGFHFSRAIEFLDLR